MRVLQEPAEPLPAHHATFRSASRLIRVDQLAVEALMVASHVIMTGELKDRPSQVLLPERHDSVETLGFC